MNPFHFIQAIVMRVCHVPGILGDIDTVLTKTDKIPALMQLTLYWIKAENKQIKT